MQDHVPRDDVRHLPLRLHVTAQIGHVSAHEGHVLAQTGHVSAHEGHVSAQTDLFCVFLECERVPFQHPWYRIPHSQYPLGTSMYLLLNTSPGTSKPCSRYPLHNPWCLKKL
eukprot:1478590-Rhodomonas_salina.2